MMNLILGTATFNAGYGISNKDIKSGDNGICEIISMAQNLGIREFDTAPSYGLAEDYLGKFLNSKLEPKISSKIGSKDATSVKNIIKSVKATLARTKVNRLKNLYLHDPNTLAGPKVHETISGLRELISLNLVERVGLSVYDLDSILRAKESFPVLSTFQVPENICDRRLRNSQELVDLQNDGNTFQVRSIFLQGLLLVPYENLPLKFSRARNVLQQLHQMAENQGVLPLDICMAYVKSIPWATGVIFGAATTSQLLKNVESQIKLPTDWESEIGTLPIEILDPRKW